MSSPAVSVVMPFYNSGQYTIDAVASILDQSFADLEVICVNDGSSDETPELLDWFATQDSRVRVHHQSNAGIVAALNVACKSARAPLLVRMDSDDCALPNRIATQVQWMNDHPQCVVCGTGILEIDSDGDPLCLSRLPQEHAQIVDSLLHRRTGHFHPSTMIRTDSFRQVGGYRQEYQWVEDHDLWLRLSEVGELCNLPEILLCYRQHAQSVCWRRSDKQRTLMNDLLTAHYQARDIPVPEGVVADATQKRSPAGAGKWARAAAKGGFVASTKKQLAALNSSSAKLSYKLRMNAEVLFRLAHSKVLVPSRSNEAVSPPTFHKWHHAWKSDPHRTAA
ncbi:MAG: glycosyltransferase family 2 protein [Pirellulaceae bacterium]